MSDTEVRVTSATGGQKGQKQAQLGAIDPAALLEVARVAGFGTEKYDRYNFLKGYDWSLSFDAMQRHALAMWSGEDRDPESGLLHIAHAAWHALALTAFVQRQSPTDDRPPRAQAAEDAHGATPPPLGHGQRFSLFDRYAAHLEGVARPDCRRCRLEDEFAKARDAGDPYPINRALVRVFGEARPFA